MLESPALPAELDYFTDGGYEYLVEEVPSGQLLWDGWDAALVAARLITRVGHC